MQTVVIVIYLMIVATLIGAVLLQKSEGGGLGMGGGAGFMSSRGTANLLTRTTAVLARQLRPQACFGHWHQSCLAVAAGRWRYADRPADEWRHPGYAQEGGRT